jgi:transposase
LAPAVRLLLPRATCRAAYGFSLERHVLDNHLLRKIDRFVDLSEVRTHLEPYCSETGRPSIDPELMMRMLIVGYGFGIRSERRLCEEVHLNLAYRWFCRLGLDGDVPDHSTFSKNRHGRFRESDLTRKLFESVVARCMKERIVGGEAFAVDASIIVADAHRRRGVAKVEDLDPTSSGSNLTFESGMGFPRRIGRASLRDARWKIALRFVRPRRCRCFRDGHCRPCSRFGSRAAIDLTSCNYVIAYR